MKVALEKIKKHVNGRVCLSLALALVFAAMALAPPWGGGSKAFAAGDEFRGVWVPTVLSLNYPTQKTTDPTRLQKDAVDILEQAKDMGFNAVFLQVRPAADAFYKSDIFPWSKYLTGVQGLNPDFDFDPLAYFVQEAHARGIQLHAWINPYRVTAEENDFASLAANHPARLHPDWIVTYKDGKVYWNPGIPEVQQLIVDGVNEILDKYNVDGIHIDDYFYPGTDFDDAAAYAAHGSGYANLSEWRYANTEATVKNLYEATHRGGRPSAFGVSPMGIWANKSSNSLGSDTRGGEGYVQRYADARGWVKRGIVDYIAPQIYWNIGYEIAEYKTLVNWWADVTRGTDVKLYIGQAAYRTGNTAATSPWHGVAEIQRQLEYNRGRADVAGYIMYSFGSFTGNIDLYSLMQGMNHLDSTGAPQYVEPTPPAQPVAPATPKFTDLADHWAAADIGAMAALGFVKGYPEGDFKPDAPIKRADFVLMLMNMLPYDASGKTAAPFLDIAPDAYYLDALRDARRMGIVTGAGDDMFFPDDEIMRQDMMAMAYRALTVTGYLNASANTQVLDGFSDRGAVASYATTPVAALVERGYVNGIDGKLEPRKSTTRAETATLLYRFYRAFLAPR